MNIPQVWFGTAASAVALLTGVATAAELTSATSSGFSPGARYHPDPPYRSTSKIDVQRMGSKPETSIVLRGPQAIIGLVWPAHMVGSEPPRVLTADGTPLQTRATVAPLDTLGSAAAGESGDRLMMLAVVAPKPGRYRLATASGGGGARSLIVQDGSAFALEVWMPQLFYRPTDPLLVYAHLYNPETGAILPGSKVTARAHPSGIRAARLNDDGIAPDEVANDGVYTGRLDAAHAWTLHQLRRRGGEVEVTVRARGRLAGLRMRRVASTGFNWCVGSAGLDFILPSAVQTSVEGTRVVVPVAVTAAQPGSYHLEGNLVGRNDELVAFAEGEVWLNGGSTTIPLAFDAGIIASAGVPPPFTLRKVLLQEDSAEDPVMVDMRENLGTVDGFTLAQLGPAPTPTPDDAGENVLPPDE